MARTLIDLLWHRSPAVGSVGRRGPRPARTLDQVVDAAIALADEGGADAVTIRALAQALEMTTMSVYTHVGSRDDLLVLMADEVCARAEARHADDGARIGDWRARVGALLDGELELLLRHPWVIEVDDLRLALGPGTIAAYDRGLHAFDGTPLPPVVRDAALSFVRDFARAGAARIVRERRAEDVSEGWAQTAQRLSVLLGDQYPLAQAVGRAAGEELGAPYDARRAWEFGRERIIAGLADLIEDA